jgi:recombination protein RecA
VSKAPAILRLSALPGVHRARLERRDSPKGWCLAALAGRLIELCSHDGPDAALTLAFRLVLEAQGRDEPVAWVTATASFYPPDVVAGGVDLDALVVARAPDVRAALQAADQLARSGAFGLLILDLAVPVGVPMALLSRLLGLAQKHDVAIVLVTQKSSAAPSLGSLISLRAETRRARRGDRFVCALTAIKDKRRAPGWTHEEVCRGPAGLR